MYWQQVFDMFHLWLFMIVQNSRNISSAIFDEFVWPSFKAYYDLCVEMNVIPIFLLDSCWDLVLDRFATLEEKTYIMALDSKTDIREVRRILGPNVCILGEVPCE